MHNLICSQAVPEIIRENGGTPVRTRVGHSFIKQVMAETGAIFGGEHSAHYYFRDNWRADSGSIAALCVLEQLSPRRTCRCRSCASRSSATRRAARSTRGSTTRAAVIEQVADGVSRTCDQDRLDGLTVDCGDWWFNLRPSNTEPLLRLNLEAADAASLRGAHRRSARARSATRGVTHAMCARPEAARDPRLPRGQGPAAVLRRRERALQPAAEAALPRAGRHPDHAHRRGRDRRRRRGRAADEESGRGRHHADLRGNRVRASTARRDRRFPAFLDAVGGLPEQLAAAHEARGRAAGRALLPAASSVRNIVVLGMGGSGISGDVIAAACNDELPVPLHGAEAVPRTGVRRTARRSRSRCRTRVTPRRRCRWRAPRSQCGARLIAISRGGELAELAARCTTACTCPAPTGSCRAPRSARSSRRSPSSCSAWVSHRARHALLVRAQAAARAVAAMPASRASKARRIPRASWRARSAARSRSIYGGGALGAVAAYRWKCDVNENAKAPAYLARVPGARPQRDLRLGPARRRDAPADHGRGAAPRIRARAAPAPVRHHARDHRGGRAPGALGPGRRRGPPRAAARPHVPRRLGVAATSRWTTTSIPDRSRRSSN